jgi:acetyl-CoA carboxylase carboxyl transferase beta subunit
VLNKSMFIKPRNALEGEGGDKAQPSIPDALCRACPACKATAFSKDLEENAMVCPHCGHHLRMDVKSRLRLLVDEGSFAELFPDLETKNPIQFPDYEKKLAAARKATGRPDGVVCGTGRIGGMETALFVMDPQFMMGSMGTVVGEKIARTFEFALSRALPVVGVTVSGGARIQEGIFSLMQMAKTSGAVLRHSKAGNLYIALLTDPTTGGVTASFAMEADVILAEPGALIGFAGPRVIEQTIRAKLPEGFQRAEFLLEKGFVDRIVPRSEQKSTIAALLGLHERKVGA